MKATTKKLGCILRSKGFIFALAAISMFIITFSGDFLAAMGDALETWKVSETFFSEDKYYSYVMYKGIYAFIPCVIDYFVSALLNIPSLYIFKAFNAVCFAYVAVYGIPNLVDLIYENKKVYTWQRYLLVAVLLVFEYSINYCISVDMFSCTLFFMLCNSAISFSKDDNHKWHKSFFLGLLLGINMCLSGQFSISTVIIAVAIVVNIVYKHFKEFGVPQINSHRPLIATILLIAFGFIVARIPNELYLDLIVWPAKEAGEWIPTGGEWIVNGLSANLRIINFPKGLPDYLGLQFLNEEQNAKIDAGGYVFSYSDYFKMVLQNPVLFLVRWSERLFLGMFNDPENRRIFATLKGDSFNEIGLPKDIHIIFMSVFVYGFYDRFKERFNEYKDFISLEIAVYIGFLFSALVPSFGHVENRYFFAARCLVYGVFIMTPFLSDGFDTLKQKIKNKDLGLVSYRFWGCLLFILISFIIYYAIYQSAGV